MVSPAGLGCGGYSRLGMLKGGDEAAAEAVVRHALELDVNFFDTAPAYGTEEVVGRALAGRRDDVVISSKTMYRTRDGEYLSADDILKSIEQSLVRLKTDYIDVFSLHGVTDRHLDYCLENHLPLLEQQKALGKIRHLGITEHFMAEPEHDMLIRALEADCFDVAMVGFNFLNTSARDSVFRLALENNIGTQLMHAVRRALADADVLQGILVGLIETGEVDAAEINIDDPLDFVTSQEGVDSVTEAAYRYCRHEPGVSVVLTGTGSQDHLGQNVKAIMAQPLPVELKERLDTVFGRVRSVSGD
jgi:aryl-alcohol dehydrogenase-like predicted oxidoreductase